MDAFKESSSRNWGTRVLFVGGIMTKKVKTIIGILAGVLIAVTIALAIPLGIYVNRYEQKQLKVNGLYEKSYYEAMDSLENVATKLSKVNVVSGTTVKRELLNDIWKETDIVVSNFSQLGRDSDETEKVVKFINQLGDYCYYLSGKVSSGEELTKTEKENIKKFYDLVSKFKTDFSKIGESLEGDKEINATTLSDLSAFTGTIKNYSSIDYPELIYDGPFSDGLNDREAKFLKGKTIISENDAIGKLKTYFKNAKDVKIAGESKSNIESYVLTFELNGKQASAFITKNGGYLANFNTYMENNNPQYDENACIAKGKEFLNTVGYASMECVWVYNNNSSVYLNFAYKDGETVYYPDLIELKVSADSGEVIGLEAQNYIYNHGERNVELDKSAESAIKINAELAVENTMYCVIPTEWNEEVFCKEVKGTYENLTYYIYYDLSTGEEIRAMVVIDEDGNKLI